MKFGRVLRTTAEDLPDLPELQALFSAYKQLKKQVKKLPDKEALHQGVAAGLGSAAHPAVEGASAAASSPQACERAEGAFIESLGRTLAQMNDMFLEKEETSVIRVEQLEAALAAAGDDVPRLETLHQEFVNFHGEVLLLVHWSILAYTATVKILKKHHKRTGLLLRAPLGNLLSQPFCSTEMMTDIAHRVEADIRALCERMHAVGTDSAAPAGASPTAAGRSEAPIAGLAPQLSMNGLDMALLQRLAAAGGPDSPTSSDGSELDTEAAGNAGVQRAANRVGGPEGPRQEAEELEAADDPNEVEQAAAEHQHHHRPGQQEENEAHQGRDHDQHLAGADAPPVRQQQRPPGAPQRGEQSAASSERSCGEAVLAAMGPPPAKRARLGEHSSSVVHCDADGSGVVPSGAQGGLARPCSILRQAQVALTTWEHLIASASTPSTVMAFPPSARTHTHTTESSVA